MADNELNDVILASQLNIEFDEGGITHKEDIFSYCCNAMIISASDILMAFHEDAFRGIIKTVDSKAPVPDFEMLKGDLEDVVFSLFSVLNYMGIDAPVYAEVELYKESIPMIFRTDRILSTSGLIQSITDLYGLIWQTLDRGNELPIQKMGTDEEAIEDEILEITSSILAFLDTICQHLGKSLRSIL